VKIEFGLINIHMIKRFPKGLKKEKMIPFDWLTIMIGPFGGI